MKADSWGIWELASQVLEKHGPLSNTRNPPLVQVELTLDT